MRLTASCIPSTTLRHFWTTLAHYHGQKWNGSELARLGDAEALLGHPKVGASLERLAVELLIRRLRAEPEE